MGINHKNITFSRLYKAIKLICSALSQTEMTDFSTLSYTTLTSKIPTLSYTWSLKKVPLRAEPPRIGHYREYPPLPDLKTEKKLRGCQRGAYILVWQRVWIMKLLHDYIHDPLKQTKRTLWCFARLTINSVSGCFRRFSGKFLKQTERLKRHSAIFLLENSRQKFGFHVFKPIFEY